MMYLGIDTSDAVRIDSLFSELEESDKNMALAYLSALRDKAIASQDIQPQAG